jgi:hypothetical protein
LASRFILKAASKLQTQEHAEKLAAVAQRCNAWATELAVEEATRDYHRAYDVQTQTVGDKRPSEATIEQQQQQSNNSSNNRTTAATTVCTIKIIDHRRT